MKKLVVMTAGACAALSMAVIGAKGTLADPGFNVLNVIGEPYGKAVAILRNQGVKATFGGSIGSDLPQPQCVVIDQQTAGSARFGNAQIKLRLDCTLPKGAEMPAAPNTHSLVPPGGSVPAAGTAPDPNRPTPGAGTVTVTPVPIG